MFYKIILVMYAHEKRSLVDYSQWSHKESDTTEPSCTMHNKVKDILSSSNCEGQGT